MPEHFHLLIRPDPPEATVRFMQELKKRTAQQIVAALARLRIIRAVAPCWLG